MHSSVSCLRRLAIGHGTFCEEHLWHAGGQREECAYTMVLGAREPVVTLLEQQIALLLAGVTVLESILERDAVPVCGLVKACAVVTQTTQKPGRWTVA